MTTSAQTHTERDGNDWISSPSDEHTRPNPSGYWDTTYAGLRPDLAATVSEIVRELSAEFGGRFPRHELEQCVDRTVRDLSGSISFEALPEMSIRLASVRLAARTGVPFDATVGGEMATGSDHSATS